jgi:glucose-6-phosphate isomerase
MSIRQTPAWQALAAHRDQLAGRHLRELFAADRQRFSRLSFAVDGLLADFSKQRITAETLALLAALAEEAGVAAWRDRMFAGEAVNTGEGRAALHVAWRADAADRYLVDGREVMTGITAERERMRQLCDAVRNGEYRGFSGAPIRHVVNLGIGGSDLGPRMAAAALAAICHPALTVDFVANVDGADLAAALAGRDPRSTLFIVASKTFTTLETLANAHSACQWLQEAAGDGRELALSRHFVAVTANAAAAREFGIAAERVFAFSDWVGGRFSLWSPIGLPLALAIGFDAFAQLLAGARRIDRHFREAPVTQNVPLLMALTGLWNRNFLDATTLSVVPYSHALRLLPDYLQQLEMESNGKSVGRDGEPLDYPTAPAIFGGAGTNAQHAYFQWLHQGPRPVPTDFIVCARSEAALPGHHEQLLANCLAQSAALAFGDETTADGGSDRQRACPGNQPSTTLLVPQLDPYHLGMLLACYEHKTFAQGILWGINPFDQWGVELGKRLARRLLPLVADDEAADPPAADIDSSTTGLAAHLRSLRGHSR